MRWIALDELYRLRVGRTRSSETVVRSKGCKVGLGAIFFASRHAANDMQVQVYAVLVAT